MERKLYRSEDNKIFLGICGGIGEYFDIDPVIVRVILVALIFVGFSGILAYIVAAFIIPKRPYNLKHYTNSKAETKKDSTIHEDYSSKSNRENQND